jgi:hypothetical protein
LCFLFGLQVFTYIYIGNQYISIRNWGPGWLNELGSWIT